MTALVVIGVTAWLAGRPGAPDAQHGMVVWLNQPPAPFGRVLALTNPWLRPLPLAAVSAGLVGWVLVSVGSIRLRLEVARALVIAMAVAEIGAQVLKHLADQARPLAVIPGLDTHGYPIDPAGNAYPSAHTALVVAAVAALWPWMRTSQRVVAVFFAVLVALNRLYIGAHWPIDVLGGAAVGAIGGTVAWTVARKWPLTIRPS
jgi:undecaprenyl-diphosphatase